MADASRSERLGAIVEAITSVARGDYSAQVTLSGSNDELDSIGIGLNMMAEDLQERTRERNGAERALRESEEKYRLLIESARESIVLLSADGAVLLVNGTAARLMGGVPEDYVGKTVWDVFPRDIADAKAAETRRVVHTGEPETAEVRLPTQSGERWLLVSKQPVRDAAGNITGVLAVGTDITDRRRAEDALRESEERFRLLFEQSNDAVFIHDLEGRILDVNARASEMLGYHREQLLNMPVPTLHPESELERSKTAFQRVSAEGHARFESAFRKADETIIDVEISSRLTDAAKGTVQGIVRDITDRKRAEDALRESEQDHRMLLDMLPDIVYRIDQDGRFERISSAVRMLGYEPSELIGEHFSRILHPDDVPRVSRAMVLPRLKGKVTGDKDAPKLFDERRTGKRMTRNLEVRLNPKKGHGERQGGTDIFAIVSAMGEVAATGYYDPPVDREDRRFLGTIGVIRDITERKRAEERYRDLFENLRDAVVTVDTETGNVVDANARAEALWGRTREEIIGVHQTRLHLPELEERHRSGFQEAVAGGGREDYETEIVTKDGRIVPVSISAKVVTLEGRTHLLGTFRDITERKRAEEALRESERRFRELADNIPEAFFTMDSEFRYTYWNAASERFTGISAKDALGKCVYEVFPDVRGTKVQDLYERALRTREPLTAENEYEVGGRKYTFEFTTYPFADGLAVLCRDVTEHRSLEEQLRHAQKMEAIGTLAGGIAHDFNNLLTPILGYADMLKLRSRPEDKTFRAADMIERAAKRGSDLAQQLLGFARKGKLRIVPVDMHRMIGDVVAILSRAIDRRISMRQRLAAEPSVVEGDPGQLEQIIMNLAMNARDAMPEGGELAFETSLVDLDEEYCRAHTEVAPGRYLLFSVTDTGTGIPENVRDRIFEPFFTTKEVGEGTGMGLATVYGIVKNHGGSIQFYSEVGQGTTFKVYLPLCEEAAPRRDESPSRAPTKGRGRILFVDDEESVCSIAKEVLASLGYEVEVARNGREAVEHYRKHGGEIDLVVLDMTMPVMNGRDCFRALKELDPGVKVLLTTGHALDGAAQELLDEGMVGFVQKPYMVAGLSEAIAKAMRVRA